MSQDFQSLIDRLLKRGLEACFYPMGLDGEIMATEQETEPHSGHLTGVRILRISKLLNGLWRTRDLAGALEEGFSVSEVADYAERRLKAGRAEYDAESMRRNDVESAQKPPDLNLPEPVFWVGEP
jgi:hypothetical protein